MRELEQRPGGSSASNDISNAVVHITHEYTGRGPTKCRTIINRDSVMVLLGETLTKAERKLAAIGKEDYVLQTRKEFQRAMRDELVAAIETIMERKVIAFFSDHVIEPDMALEAFVLEPRPEEATSGLEAAEQGERPEFLPKSD